MDTGKKFLLTVGTGRESRKRLRLVVGLKPNGKYQSKCKIQGVCLMNNQDNIIATKKAIAGHWLRQPGVTGMDVGFKYVGGKLTADVAIRLFVRKKLAEVTPGERFPGLVGQHKTDVIESELEAYNGYYHTLLGRGELSLSSSGKTHIPFMPGSVEFGGIQNGNSVSLTCTKLQTTAPTGGWRGNIWNQSESGIYSYGAPWTITSVYQTLTFLATAIDFESNINPPENQPVFRWWINGRTVSDFNFNTNVANNMIVPAAVMTDTPQNAPVNPTKYKLEQVSLQINAQGSASSADNTAVLIINPTIVQGHIPLTVVVDVCTLGDLLSPPVPTSSIYTALIRATLDTQVLTSQ